MSTADIEDVFLWPNGDWCYRYEYSSNGWRSDDFEVLPYGCARWSEVVG